MNIVVPLLFATGAGLLLGWMFLPRLIARRICKTSRRRTASTEQACAATDSVLTSLDHGIHIALCCRQKTWSARLARVPAQLRPISTEGIGAGFGILTSIGRRRWSGIRSVSCGRRVEQALLFRGAGIWLAKRFGRDLDRLGSMLQSLRPSERIECMNGYGFKYGFFEFPGDRRSIAHLQEIAGAHRRAAFQGLGRAFFLHFAGNRRELFEVVSDLTAGHDGDVMEGAGYCAAFHSCENPRLAIDFARATPLEWRPHVHLGMTLALRDRREHDRAYFESCIGGLPATSIAAIEEIIRLATETYLSICSRGDGFGHFVWQERLLQSLEAESIWETLHADAMKAGTSVLRGKGARKEESR